MLTKRRFSEDFVTARQAVKMGLMQLDLDGSLKVGDFLRDWKGERKRPQQRWGSITLTGNGFRIVGIYCPTDLKFARSLYHG